MMWWGRFAKPPIFSPPGRALPELESGDLVAILSAGAYGAVMASAYNARPPAAGSLGTGRRMEHCTAQRNDDDLIAKDRIPDWLAG